MSKMNPMEVTKRLGTIKKALPAIGKLGTLSVCMIVKNEENNIARAINSFLPFADEIVVNDTGSTDRTLEILAGLPKVRVIQSTWKGDFSYARNLSIEEAKCSWILWMDADDFVPPEQVKNFLKLKTAPLDRAFGFQVINTQGGLPVGIRFTQTRMFPNHPRIRFERKVHEQVVHALAELGLHLINTEAILWHMGYEDPKLNKAKALRNLELQRDSPYRNSDPTVPMQIADSYAIMEDWDKAVEVCLEALAIPNIEEINHEVYKNLLVTTGRCLQRSGRYDEAMQWVERALQVNEGNSEAMFYKAEILIAQKKKKEAQTILQKVLNSPHSPSILGKHYDTLRMYSYKYLCDIEGENGNMQDLQMWAEKFFSEYPQILESQIYMGQAFFAQGNFFLAAQHLEDVVRKNAKVSKFAWNMLMACYEKMQDHRRLQETKLKMLEVCRSENAVPPNQGLLSVCMIVKNEEKNLIDCIASMQGLYDDLVIVDTGSTDATKEIAHKMGARVFDAVWKGDFSAARNVSLREATCANILWVDADDRFLPGDIARLRRVLQEKPGTSFGLLVKNTGDGGATGSVFNQIRVFPNFRGIEFSGRVHEQLLDSIRRQSVPVEFTDIRILHTGYVEGEVVRQKQQRNLDILLGEFRESPHKISAVKLYSIGGAYADLGEIREAMNWYSKAMEQAENRGEDSHIRQVVPIRLAACLADLGDKELALQQISVYLQANPVQVEALALKAKLLVATNQKESAALFYGRLLHFRESPTFVPVDFQQFGVVACKYLGEYWADRGLQSLAVEILRLGLALGKGQEIGPLKLPSLYFDQELYEFALDNVEFGLLLNDDPLLRLCKAKILILSKSAEESLSYLKQSHQKFPADKEIAELLELLLSDLSR